MLAIVPGRAVAAGLPDELERPAQLPHVVLDRRYVILTYVKPRDADAVDAARKRLIDAQRAYESARIGEYTARLVRDDAMVEVHRAGLSSRAIGEILGGMDQANVVRARRRAVTRREAVPEGLLSPADALRRSGLSPSALVNAVRRGQINLVAVEGEVRAFRPEDVDALQRPV